MSADSIMLVNSVMFPGDIGAWGYGGLRFGPGGGGGGGGSWFDIVGVAADGRGDGAAMPGPRGAVVAGGIVYWGVFWDLEVLCMACRYCGTRHDTMINLNAQE